MKYQIKFHEFGSSEALNKRENLGIEASKETLVTRTCCKTNLETDVKLLQELVLVYMAAQDLHAI